MNYLHFYIVCALILLVTFAQEIELLKNPYVFYIFAVIYAITIIPLMKYDLGLSLLLSSLLIIIWSLKSIHHKV
jgi:hypothetical protein